MPSLPTVMKNARACTECVASLPHGPRPVFTAHKSARIVVIGQAPGRKVHESGIPWDDASGERLRDWIGVSNDVFYDPKQIALVPMGFCYPGTGKSGDLPPRPECAPLWHEALLDGMPNIRLTLLIGQYAQGYYLGDKAEKSLTATVQAWKRFTPAQVPLPHPSPRNNIWLRKNPWFEEGVLPYLRRRVRRVLAG